MQDDLIKIQNCKITGKQGVIINDFSWEMKTGEAWLVTGENGSGKADFINALSGILKIEPSIHAVSTGGTTTSTADGAGFYENAFFDSCELVSFEKAARLIQEERENDDSEFIEGGVDIGRTGRIFIAEGIVGKIKKGSEPPKIASELDAMPEIKLCGVEKILDRGIKYMSTGEIRRVMIARALVSKKRLLILSDPFSGLDAETRAILFDFFDTIAKRQLINDSSSTFPKIILCAERFVEIPRSITNVLEWSGKKISFIGKKSDYEKLLEKRKNENVSKKATEREEFKKSVLALSKEVENVLGTDENDFFGEDFGDTLVEMNDVNVSWGDNHVLRHLTWKLKRGEHFLIRGPNGSGKTTFLELITGDNKQVYCNDVKLFGKKRGSGETIWDIKHKMGIVSYRLHVEYRMVGSTSLVNVLASGFHDSIGLYEKITEQEEMAAKKWLSLGGFSGREDASFSSLSYGEQRAILILRAAVKCPPIMILDEPCHALDENYRQKILHLLEIIAESGTTTLLHVTHEESEILPCEKHTLELKPCEEPMYVVSRN